MKKNARQTLLTEAQPHVPDQWTAIRTQALRELPVPVPRRFPWPRVAAAAAALCAVIALCFAAGLIPRTVPPASLLPEQGNMQGNMQDDMQELNVSLPTMLAGQAVTWEAADENSDSAGRPGAYMLGALEDGRTVTLRAEMLFSGSKEETEAWKAAHPGFADYEPSLEVGATVSYWIEGGGRYPQGREGDPSQLVWEFNVYRVFVASIG